MYGKIQRGSLSPNSNLPASLHPSSVPGLSILCLSGNNVWRQDQNMAILDHFGLVTREFLAGATFRVAPHNTNLKDTWIRDLGKMLRCMETGIVLPKRLLRQFHVM